MEQKGRKGMGFMAIRESEIERHLAVSVKKLGGMAVKFVSPGLDGVPDRIVLLPERKIAFVELRLLGRSQDRCRRSGSGSWRSWGFRFM